MENLKETLIILKDDYLLLKCKCKLCGEEFTADGLDHINVKLHWHTKSNQECWMPQCPNGCSQTMQVQSCSPAERRPK